MTLRPEREWPYQKLSDVSSTWDKMIGEAEVLRPLVEECLDDDPAVRPTIATVCERIQVSKDVYMKECSQDVITLCQQNQQLKAEISLLRNENEQQRTALEHMVMIIS